MAELQNLMTGLVFGEQPRWRKVGKGFEIFVQIFRAKPGGGKKRACRVEVDMLRSWVLPPLIEEHARRFGGPFQH